MNKKAIGAGAAVLAAAAVGAVVINLNAADIEETDDDDVVSISAPEMPEGLTLFEDGGTAAASRPAMWKVTAKDGESLYMMGSVHALNAGCYPLPDYVREAYEQSSGLAVEITNVTAADFISSAQAPDNKPAEGKSLKDTLSAETYAQLEKFAADNGVDMGELEGYRPWYVYQALVNVGGEDGKYSGEYGLDRVMQIQCIGDGKPRYSLESEQARAELYSAMPQEALELRIRQLGSDLFSMDELAAAWQDGDIERLGELNFEPDGLSEEDAAAWQSYLQYFIYDRSRAMTDSIEGYLEDGESIFVVAGSAHFVGENGIPEMLRADGYTVERVDK